MTPEARRALDEVVCETLAEIYPGTTWYAQRPKPEADNDQKSSIELAPNTGANTADPA
jgi:hypothetical protein